VPPEKAFLLFSKMSKNDYVIEFSYKALEFDEAGNWLTLQLIFNEPLYVSLGDFPDTAKLYLQRDFFLWKWYPVVETTDVIGCYNCENRRRLEGQRRLAWTAKEGLIVQVETGETFDPSKIVEEDYIVLDVELPPMVKKDEEALLDLISNLFTLQFENFFVILVLLSMVYQFPTYQLWMLSSLLQMIEITTYLQINLPGNVIQIADTATDFIHLYSPLSPDFFYSFIEPFYQSIDFSSSGLKQIGLDKFIKLRGTTNTVYNLVNFYVMLVLILMFVTMLQSLTS
jgi:hypothetical protein